MNGQFPAIVLVLVSTAVIGCGPTSRIEGDWNLNRIELRFAAGIATVKNNGVVFLEYEDLGAGKLRYRQIAGDSNLDVVVSVAFPGEGEMIWYLGEGADQRKFREFTRP